MSTPTSTSMFKRFTTWRARRRWEADRIDAECRASNGEHLPRLEREYYNLPDWTK